MRHVIVRRVVVLMAAALLAAAAAFVWAVRDEPPSIEPGATAITGRPTQGALFSQHCGDCHSAADLRAAATRGATRAEWERFLPGHADVPDEERRAILDYLFRAGRTVDQEGAAR